MRSITLAVVVSLVALCGVLALLAQMPTSSPVSKPTPLILGPDDGEQREFRTRPGVTFTVKIDPTNGGSEHMAVVTEDMKPGDKIPVHRHPHADELIFIQSGVGTVTLAGKVQQAQAGSIVFIPRDTWIGMENTGTEPLKHTDVWSEPGFQDYMRAISVPKGDPVPPLSKPEVNELRKKFSHYGIYQ